MKHHFGASPEYEAVRTVRIRANLQWTHGVDPTDEEARDISAIVSSTGPHTVTFLCPCCDKPIAVLGRDMGIGPQWIPAVEIWERLRSGETLRPKP